MMNIRLYCLKWPGNAPTESWIRGNTLGATARGLPASGVRAAAFPTGGNISVCVRVGELATQLVSFSLLPPHREASTWEWNGVGEQGNTSLFLSVSSVVLQCALRFSAASPPGSLLVFPPYVRKPPPGLQNATRFKASAWENHPTGVLQPKQTVPRGSTGEAHARAYLEITMWLCTWAWRKSSYSDRRVFCWGVDRAVSY